MHCRVHVHVVIEVVILLLINNFHYYTDAIFVSLLHVVCRTCRSNYDNIILRMIYVNILHVLEYH